MGKNTLIFISVVVVPLLSIIIGFTKFSGLLVQPITYKEKFDNCTYLDEITPGPEDITKYNKTVLIFGAGDLMNLFAIGDPMLASPGQMYAIYNADKYNFNVKKLTINNFPPNTFFSPHGIYLTHFDDGEYLYVVNHAYDRGGERIEVYTNSKQQCFKIINDQDGLLQLNYISSIVFGTEFTGVLNDLVVISKNQLFVTQYQYKPNDVRGHKYDGVIDSIQNFLSRFLLFKVTNLYHCKFDHKSKDNLLQPTCIAVKGAEGVSNNGITYDGKHIYVADCILKNVRKFLLTENSQLTQIDVIDLPGSIDNIEFDPDTNKIYVGLIPRVMDYLYYKYLGTKNGGILDKNLKIGYWSAVAEFSINDNQAQLVHQEQDIQKGTTTAYAIGQNLFLGSWGEQSLTVCRRVKQ